MKLIALLQLAVFLASSLFVAAVPTTVRAEIYMYIDENGVRHFTNVPMASVGEEFRFKIYKKGDARKEAARPFSANIESCIEQASRLHGISTCLLRAVIKVESDFNPKAVSKKGAVGLMQIMPHTFKEIRKKNPAIKGTREQPRWNIAAGIYYDRQLWRTWKAERPFQDRLNFTFGAYNAGKMNIIRAQKAAKKSGLDPNRWASICKTLPGVTGKHSRETIGYVDKIETITEVLH